MAMCQVYTRIRPEGFNHDDLSRGMQIVYIYIYIYIYIWSVLFYPNQYDSSFYDQTTRESLSSEDEAVNWPSRVKLFVLHFFVYQDGLAGKPSPFFYLKGTFRTEYFNKTFLTKVV